MNISVVVPVRNEEASIREFLDGLINQTWKPHEIIITDGGSTDSTPEIITEYKERGAPLQLIKVPAALPGRGRNLAAAQASGEWLAFIDAGVRPENNWLECLAKRASKANDVDVVYGSYHPVTDTLFKECAAIAYLPPPKEVEGGLFTRAPSIASALVRRKVWESIGGFPENLRSAEDLLFMNKVEQAGYRIVNAPDAVIHWNLQPTFQQTFRRFVVYARNNIRAGLWKQWQAAIFRRYALLVLSALPAIVVGYRWLLVTAMLWLLMLSARAVVSIRRNRTAYPGTFSRNARRVTVLIPLIAVLDTAAIVGSLQWLLRDKPNEVASSSNDA
jgi:glycosyltransferase involved in cell wall biosynthesis